MVELSYYTNVGGLMSNENINKRSQELKNLIKSMSDDETDIKEETAEVVEEIVDVSSNETIEVDKVTDTDSSVNNSEEINDEPSSEKEVEEVIVDVTSNDSDNINEEPSSEESKNVEDSNKKSEKSNDYKDERIAKQSNELTYLTNNIIPNLKKEIKELRAVKVDLTDALEKSTKKYYEQLDINVDLSDSLTKISAEHAVNKVRLEKLDSTIATVKKEANDKVDKYKSKLSKFDTNELNQLMDSNEKLSNDNINKDNIIKELEDKSAKLQGEVLELRNKLIELGSYKDEVDAKTENSIKEYKNTITQLNRELSSKQHSYDQLARESQRTIGELEAQVTKYKEAIEKHANRGLFDRLSNKPIEFDD